MTLWTQAYGVWQQIKLALNVLYMTTCLPGCPCRREYISSSLSTLKFQHDICSKSIKKGCVEADNTIHVQKTRSTEYRRNKAKPETGGGGRAGRRIWWPDAPSSKRWPNSSLVCHAGLPCSSRIWSWRTSWSWRGKGLVGGGERGKGSGGRNRGGGGGEMVCGRSYCHWLVVGEDKVEVRG